MRLDDPIGPPIDAAISTPTPTPRPHSGANPLSCRPWSFHSLSASEPTPACAPTLKPCSLVDEEPGEADQGHGCHQDSILAGKIIEASVKEGPQNGCWKYDVRMAAKRLEKVKTHKLAAADQSCSHRCAKKDKNDGQTLETEHDWPAESPRYARISPRPKHAHEQSRFKPQ